MFFNLYIYHFRRWVYHNTLAYFILLSMYLFYTFTISGDWYTTTFWSILHIYHFRRWVYHNTLVYFILWVHVFFNFIPLPLQEMGIPQHFCLFYAISPCFYYIPLSFQEMGIPHHFGLFYAMGPCFF
jgi:hypothetical protein